MTAAAAKPATDADKLFRQAAKAWNGARIEIMFSGGSYLARAYPTPSMATEIVRATLTGAHTLEQWRQHIETATDKPMARAVGATLAEALAALTADGRSMAATGQPAKGRRT